MCPSFSPKSSTTRVLRAERDQPWLNRPLETQELMTGATARKNAPRPSRSDRSRSFAYSALSASSRLESAAGHYFNDRTYRLQ